mgnify:CR=1 FL=1
MRIVLVHPNYHSGGAEIAGNWPPAWVAYLAGHLRAAGFDDIVFIDAMTNDRELSDEGVKLLRARHETRSSQLPIDLTDGVDASALGIDLTRELIAAERQFIHALLRDGKINDEARRRIERDLDLEEASLANREYRHNPL